MATIRTRKQTDGTTRYCAIVRIRRDGDVLHQEAKTFSHLGAAQRWARNREVQLEDPAALHKERESRHSLGSLIRWYIATFEPISRWQRSKQAHLKFLERHPISDVGAVTLDVATLIDHVTARRADGTGPATVANDLVWIGVVLRAAKSVRGLPVHPEYVQEARNACRELRLTGKSRRRTRRPTADELTILDEFFRRRDDRSQLPMREIMWFAIHSARRQSEICRIRWSDNDTQSRTGLVQDAKHPTAREGNHRRFKYTMEAWQIMERQPKGSDRIFPFSERSVSAAFTRACAVLGIHDLRFHDLRHEATSRLFERGYQIHEVAQFTLHDSWNELKRYANLRPELVRELPMQADRPQDDRDNDSKVSRSDRRSAMPPSRAVDRSTRPGRQH